MNANANAHVGAAPLAVLLATLVTACVGTTGSDLVTFDAFVAGPARSAAATDPYEFTSGHGYDVVLTTATMHVGGVYLNRARPTSGAQATECILPGIYVAEVTAGKDFNVLSPDPQPFPVKGEGTQDPAIVGEVWLTHDNIDVNAVDDPAPVVTVEGTASKDGASFPFQGTITIGANRAVPVADPSLPSAHPICKQRIVSPVAVNITPKNGGSLLVRVDPAGWFTNVDFAQLTTKSAGAPPVYQFDDGPLNQPDKALYDGLHAVSGAYVFSWSD